MIKKIYYLSVSIISIGFLLNTNPAYASATCTTYCQENMCRHSPDLASICYKECPQAQACHVAAFDEFRKLHEQNQRSKKTHTRKKPGVPAGVISETPALTVPIDDISSIETSSGIPIPPAPPPSLEVRKMPITSTSEALSSNIHKMPETLMDQIRAGKELNKAQESETQKPETLMDQIRAGTQLKNAQERELSPESSKPETLMDQIRAGTQLKNAQERELSPESPKPETLMDQIRAGKKLNKPVDRVPSKVEEDEVSDLSKVDASE